MSTVFDRMASLVTLADLASPLGPELLPETSIEDAMLHLETVATKEDYDPTTRFSLIADAGEVSGWVDFYALAAAERPNVQQVAFAIKANQILTASTSALKAADLICTSSIPIYFVLKEDKYIGSFCYADLFSPPFRLCLFSLTLQLEEVALTLLLQDAEESIGALNENRIALAQVVFQKRYGEATEISASNLLRCTTFCDKATILVKRKLLKGLSNTQIQSAFKRAEKVRNHCAHPDNAGTTVLDQEKLAEFIENTNELLRMMTELIFASGV